MSKHIAVVTGAGSGIGRAIAEAIAQRGGSVLVSDIDEASAAETVARIEAAGGRAICQVADVSDAGAWSALLETSKTLGDVDLLVNNAGVMVGGPVDEVPASQWELILGVNLWGPIHGVRTFVPGMKARGRGAILNVASIAGFIAPPETAPYNITKAALVSLSETLSAELGPWNIDVTCLCPTAVRTNIFDNMITSNPDQVTVARKSAGDFMSGGARDPAAVAERALDAVERGDLYVFPQTDGKLLWALKRAAPKAFTRLFREVRNRGLMEKMAK